jgi:hypothetical protein
VDDRLLTFYEEFADAQVECFVQNGCVVAFARQ